MRAMKYYERTLSVIIEVLYNSIEVAPVCVRWLKKSNFVCIDWSYYVCVFSSQKYIHEDEENSDYVMYDLDELDLNWLESVNSKRKFRGKHFEWRQN